MKDQAIAKIKAEMEANKSDMYVQGAGTLLIRYLEAHPEAAGKVLPQDVTLKKATQAMQDEAKRKAGSARAYWMSDEEGMGIVFEYFGIKAAPAEDQDKQATVQAFDVDLDKLLGL